MREIRSVRGVEKESRSVIHYEAASLIVEEGNLIDKPTNSGQEPQKKNLSLTGKKTIPQETAAKSDKKWAKLEEKTEKLLAKADKKATKSIAESYVKHSQDVAETYVKRSLIKRRASYIEFLCMKGIKKEILLSIKEKAFQEGSEWFSMLDTSDIEARTGSKANIIRDAIYRMKEEGWFEIIHSSYNGSRLLKISAEHFKF